MPNINGQQFPYDEQGMAQAAQAAQGQGGPVGPGGPGGPEGFNPDQNPFEQIMAQAEEFPQAGQPMAPEEMPLELQEGKTGDNTKPLLAAIHNLHNYVSLSTDSAEIRIIRNLINALTQLVSRDQDRSLNGEGPQPPMEAQAAPGGQAAQASAPTPQLA